MSWFTRFFARRRIYNDLSAEIQEHLEEKVDELMAGGMSREEAVSTAQREFGNALLLEERGREVWRWPTLDTIFTEARYALRQLRRSPGFTITVLLTLTLAIGINTAVFSIVDAMLLRPLPYPEPQRLASVVTQISGQYGDGVSTNQDGETWELVRDQAPSLNAAVCKLNTSGVNLQTPTSVRYVHEQRVSASYFDVLGIHPILGRGFSREEDLPGGPPVVLLSYELWNSVFNLDRDIVGKAIRLKGEPFTVVGVLPEGTKTTSPPADLWTPLRPKRTGEGEGINYSIVARLKDGMNWVQADSELGRLQPSSFALRGGNGKVKLWLSAMPLQKRLAYEGSDAVLILMCAVSAILLIACANLAGLLLVRVMHRSPEIATRIALGATRGTILRQLMMEPIILAVAGGIAGLALATASLNSLARLLSSDVRIIGNLALDGRILGFAVTATFCATLLIALFPALELRRAEIRFSIASGRSVAHTSRRRTRQALIAAEVALTVVLLAGAGLLVRTLIHLQTLPPGFDGHNVLTAQASLNDARYRDAAPFQKLLHDSITTMKQIPGVESAAVGLSLPYERALNTGVDIVDVAKKPVDYVSDEVYVTPEYFTALRIPVLAGRTFAETDAAGTQPVCVVNLRFARRYLDGLNAIGHHLRTEDVTYEVVGVVGDVIHPPGIYDAGPLTTEPTFYIPATQANQEALNIYHVWFQPSWIVRTRGPIDGLPGAMQKALAEADPALPFSGFHRLGDLENVALDRQRMEVFLIGVLALLALILSMIGIYGLVSNLVAQRTREIGIRMALGSTLKRTMMEMATSGIMAAALGAVAGMGLAVMAVRILSSELYGVRPYDPVTFGGTLAVLLAVVVVASFAPTARIAKIDPASILRAE